MIYLGLFLLGLGLTVLRSEAALGWIVTGSGIVATLAGIVLVWMRSRIRV